MTTAQKCIFPVSFLVDLLLPYIVVNPPKRKLAKRTSVCTDQNWILVWSQNYQKKNSGQRFVVRMTNMKFKYWTDSILHALHHTKSILIPSKIPSKRQVYVTPRFSRRHNESRKILRFHQNWFLYKSTILRHTKGQLISKANFLVLIWTKKRTIFFLPYGSNQKSEGTLLY